MRQLCKPTPPQKKKKGKKKMQITTKRCSKYTNINWKKVNWLTKILKICLIEFRIFFNSLVSHHQTYYTAKKIVHIKSVTDRREDGSNFTNNKITNSYYVVKPKRYWRKKICWFTWRVEVFNTTHFPFLWESRSTLAPSSSASSSGFISKI